MPDDASLDLLNIFEVQEPTGTRFLVCFLEPVLAGSIGIVERAVVGEFTPRADGEFDPATFRLNPEFVMAFAGYMNEIGALSPDLEEQGRANPGAALYLVDPRFGEGPGDPPPSDLLGSIEIDAEGRPVRGSFRYNPHHVLFDPVTGPSFLLLDRRFYDWLHPMSTG